MKKFFIVTFAFLFAVACTPAQKQGLKTALDVAANLCITANPDKTPEEVSKLCNLAPEIVPVIKTIIDDFLAKRNAYAASQMSAAHCPAAVPATK